MCFSLFVLEFHLVFMNGKSNPAFQLVEIFVHFYQRKHLFDFVHPFSVVHFLDSLSFLVRFVRISVP